jgi:hypothetical protein
MCIITCITIDHVNMIISSANTRCTGKVCSIACQKRWRRTVYMRWFFSSHVIVIGIGFTSCLYILYGKVIKMEVVVSYTHSNIMPKRLVCMGIWFLSWLHLISVISRSYKIYTNLFTGTKWRLNKSTSRPSN